MAWMINIHNVNIMNSEQKSEGKVSEATEFAFHILPDIPYRSYDIKQIP